MNKNKLLKLARFLEKLPEDKFLFHHVVFEYCEDSNKTCGSVCCAMGWTPKVFPKEVCWTPLVNGVNLDDCPLQIITGSKPKKADFDRIAMKLFDIGLKEARLLFQPDYQQSNIGWTNKKLPWNKFLPDNLPVRYYRASPKHVAKNIRAFVKWKEENV